MTGITFGELQRSVGRFLGYSRDPADWSDIETQDIWDVLKAGLTQFYFPPRAMDQSPSYQWSFLKPLGEITLVEDQVDYDLPVEFAHIIGSLYYQNEDFSSREILVVNEAKILALRMRQTSDVVNYYPRYAAITPVPPDDVNDTLWRVMVWPTPDREYTVKFKYYARQPMMTDTDAVPLGSTEHAESIRASCLAAAEAFLDDEQSNMQKRFMERLQASIDFDRKMSAPESLGYNGDRSDHRRRTEEGIRSTRLTTYEKYPI